MKRSFLCSATNPNGLQPQHVSKRNTSSSFRIPSSFENTKLVGSQDDCIGKLTSTKSLTSYSSGLQPERKKVQKRQVVNTGACLPNHFSGFPTSELDKIDQITNFKTIDVLIDEKFEAYNRESADTNAVVSPVVESVSIPFQELKTGIVFEASEDHYDGRNRLHKERPLRITSIELHLRQCSDITSRCELWINSNTANTTLDQQKLNDIVIYLEEKILKRVHLPAYIARLDKLSSYSCLNYIYDEAEQYESIYLTKDSFVASKRAAASLCDLVSKVTCGKIQNGFAIIRPPGHHAEPSMAGGYSIINNVAVASTYARTKLGVKKILIVDWDVHHGNGTQAIFLADPNVLYFSVHRYHEGNFFPYSRSSGPSTVGVGKGAGFNVNVGWNCKGLGDKEYVAVWECILLPIAKEFGPDLILVSAGFDAAAGDMGECNVSPQCFGWLTQRLMSLPGGRVVCSLEGGYIRGVLKVCVENVVRALLSKPSDGIVHDLFKDVQNIFVDMCKDEEISSMNRNRHFSHLLLDKIHPIALKCILDTKQAHAPYWKCLK